LFAHSGLLTSILKPDLYLFAALKSRVGGFLREHVVFSLLQECIQRTNVSDTPKDQQHKNDIYGDVKNAATAVADTPAIPAATVVLLRDQDAQVEVLMLHKNSKIAFGGMWVFPGGRIDAEDYPPSGDVDEAARMAAARETEEEAGIVVEPSEFVQFAHWSPPPTTPKRFATWFFVTRIDEHDPIQIDGGEIQDHAWLSPQTALARHAAGEIDLAPPTWITLYHLSLYQPATAAVDQFRSRPHKVYETRVVQDQDGLRVAMWRGDAGYDSWDADVAGERHRLVMKPEGFEFVNTVEEY